MTATSFILQTAVAALALAATPSWAQPAKARASANVDLTARLAETQANPQLASQLLTKGRIAAAVCAHCHGDGGNSVKLDIPNLAGQNPAYLLEQMRQFADGKRRFEFMEGMIKAMTADEKVGAALFYAAQTVVATPPTSTALAAKGQTYFAKNCTSCHGSDGRGTQSFARLAGQQPNYLRITLKNYRQGQGPRNNASMAAVARPMTDADIEALVTYISSMP